MKLFREIRSRLQYKIILPFLLLTLLVAMAGSAVALTIIAGSMQDRFDNQLAQTARGASDSIVRQERANLQFLRELTFAPANAETGAPALPEAVEQKNLAGLTLAVDPFFRSGAGREDLRLDRILIFDITGTTILDWERNQTAGNEITRTEHTGTNLQGLWFVQSVLNVVTTDPAGDKFAGIVSFDASGVSYLFTVAPIRAINDDTRIVGGALVARRLDTLLADIRNRNQADIVVFYDTEGKPIQSTFEPDGGINELAVDPDKANRLVQSHKGELPENEQVSAVLSVPVNERDYQFAYYVLQIRSAVVGIIGVALARDYVLGSWQAAIWPIASLTVVLMLAIIGLGVFVARMIVRPLEELAETAQAVTYGDFERRSSVRAHDEVGQLSDSFNTMTDYLVQMYDNVQAEASRSTAIVASIADGVIVSDSTGNIIVANPAAHLLVEQSGQELFPATFDELPLQPISDEERPFGGEQAANLRMLGDRIIRLNVAPVMVGQTRLGDVYVLQDLTAEAAVDRARTNFIATISHEMRTPLTVLRGYTDLMLRGLVGKMTDEQNQMLETMRQQMNNMTSLINNVIVIAGLDSGSLQTQLEPVELPGIIDEALWQVRGPINAKGLELVLELPEQLPPVLADRDQVRQMIVHLLDNARRYTSAGSITLRAHAQPRMVQIDVEDTGVGVEPELKDQIFDRFIRGSEGINSPERGIGLGLAIVRELVQRHGGSVWVESERGRGSIFSFTLQQPDGSTDQDTSNSAPQLAAAAQE